MDKEAMAKVNEILKASGRQELSMDELDQVVGGAGECFNVQDIRTVDDLNYYVYTFIASMEKSFGKDITIDIIRTQFDTNDLEKYYRNGDLDTLHNFLGQKILDGRGVH